MKTTLKDKVRLRCVSAFAEIAMLERRPEMHRLCKAASGTGLNPGRVEAVLPGLSEAACRNLLNHCRYIGLIEENGRLTELGLQCAQTSEAPSLEQGVYTFWLADHLAFGVSVLHIRRERPDPFDRTTQDLEDIFPLLGSARRTWTTAVAPKQRFVLRALPSPRNQPALGRVSEVTTDCLINWDLSLTTGENRRWIEGRIDISDGDQRRLEPVRVDLEPLPADAVRALLPRWESRWDARRGYVAITYDGFADKHQGRDTFRRVNTYAQLDVPGQGSFLNVQVREVPVGPPDAQAAADWASRLLTARLLASEGYITSEAARGLFDECVKDTPLEPFQPPAPATETLLETLERAGTREALHASWRLATPLDLHVQA